MNQTEFQILQLHIMVHYMVSPARLLLFKCVLYFLLMCNVYMDKYFSQPKGGDERYSFMRMPPPPSWKIVLGENHTV